jgi:HEAT repeat protein
MSISCSIGFHNWKGCKCAICGKSRDQAHDWSKDCEKCSKCGQVRVNQHKWNGCRCLLCGVTRANNHPWHEGSCLVCGINKEEALRSDCRDAVLKASQEILALDLTDMSGITYDSNSQEYARAKEQKEEHQRKIAQKYIHQVAVKWGMTVDELQPYVDSVFKDKEPPRDNAQEKENPYAEIVRPLRTNALDLPFGAKEPVDRILRAADAGDDHAFVEAINHMIGLLEKQGLFSDWTEPSVLDWVPRVLIKLGEPIVPILIKALDHKDWGIRWHIIEVLSLIGDPRAVPRLIDILIHEVDLNQAYIPAHLTEALVRLGDARAIPALTQISEKYSKFGQEPAKRALKILSSIPYCLPKLTDESVSVRADAARILWACNWRPQTDEEKFRFYMAGVWSDELIKIGLPAVPGLLEVLKDTYPETSGKRASAARALAGIGWRLAIPTLLEVIARDERNYEFNKEIAKALEQLGWTPPTVKDKIDLCRRTGSGWDDFIGIGESAVPDLAGALDSSIKGRDYVACEAIISVLGKIGDKSAIPYLYEALKNSSHKRSAIEALGKLGWQPDTVDQKFTYFKAAENWDEMANIGKPAVPMLLALIHGDVHPDWRKVAEALGKIGDAQAVPSLLELYNNTEGYAGTVVIIEALRKIGATEALLEIWQRVKDQSGVIPSTIVEAFGEIGDDRTIPYLYEALKTVSHAISAVAALDKIGWHPNSTEEKLAYYNAAKNWGEIAKIGKPAVPLLLELIDNESYVEYGRRASEALGKIGDPEAIPSLLQLYKKIGAWKGREFIIQALAKCAGTQAVPDLLERLEKQEECWEIREAILNALGEIGDVRAIPVLAEMLQTCGPALKESVQTSLAAIRKKVIVVNNSPFDFSKGHEWVSETEIGFTNLLLRKPKLPSKEDKPVIKIEELKK